MILGANPVYDAPADLEFADALRARRSTLAIHLGLYDDETAALCNWHVPEAHFLESWGDVRAFDGTATIQQPLIAPLYQGKTAHERARGAAGRGRPARPRDRPRRTGRAGSPAETFEESWRTGAARRRRRRARPTRSPRPKTADCSEARPGRSSPAARADGLELVFRPDPTIWDGRFANNGWLQELPKPLTKLTWDNAALISPALGRAAGVANERRRRAASTGADRCEVPVWIMPGQADDSVTVHLGYGRREGRPRRDRGRASTPIALRTLGRPLVRRRARSSRKTGGRYTLAITQHHHDMDGRDLVRVGDRRASITSSPTSPRGAEHAEHHHGLSLYPDPPRRPQNDGQRLGHGDRPQPLHRLRRLRRSPARPRTTSRSWARSRSSLARDALAADRPLLRRATMRRTRRPTSSRSRACTARRPPASWSARSRRRRTATRAQRDDLQPLRRHAVLLEQLPVQGPAVQLPPVRRRDDAEPEAAAATPT